MNEFDCVFCKIVAGEIPAKIVKESSSAIAFHDVSPKQPIHVLVVAKSHFKDISELAAADETALVDLIKLGTKVADEMSSGSFRLQFNTGEDAGQTVFHVHGHITSKTPKSE